MSNLPSPLDSGGLTQEALHRRSILKQNCSQTERGWDGVQKASHGLFRHCPYLHFDSSALESGLKHQPWLVWFGIGQSIKSVLAISTRGCNQARFSLCKLPVER